MKTVLPWVAAIAALAGVYYFFFAGQKKNVELASIRAVIDEGEQVREENDGLKKLKAQADEIARLKKDTADVAKLRNEVQQLREERQGLVNQIQSVQQTIEDARSKIPSANAVAVQPAPVVEPGSREEVNAMKQVGVALIMSAADHDDTFPTNLIGITEYLKGSFVDSKVLDQFELLMPTQRLSEIQQPASTILARGKFADANGRRTYAFADGHAEIRQDSKSFP